MTMDVSLVIGGLKGILENLCDNYSDSIIEQAASTSIFSVKLYFIKGSICTVHEL